MYSSSGGYSNTKQKVLFQSNFLYLKSLLGTFKLSHFENTICTYLRENTYHQVMNIYFYLCICVLISLFLLVVMHNRYFINVFICVHALFLFFLVICLSPFILQDFQLYISEKGRYKRKQTEQNINSSLSKFQNKYCM